ncbi:MAG: MFS transporter [Microbacterium enclense]
MSVGHRLLLAVACGIAVSSIYVAQPMLDSMSRGLGIDAGASGGLVAVGQIGYVAGLILLVPLGDVLDRRRVIAVQLALTGVGMFITSVATEAWVAFAGLALAGVFAVVVQTAVAYTAAVSPASERGRNIGVVTSGVVIGILGGRFLAGALTQAWDWQSVYLILGLLAAAVAVIAFVGLPADVRENHSPSYGRALRSLVALTGERVFWSRGLIAFFVFASFGTLWSGMALPLHASPWHLSETQVGLFGLAGLAGALGAARAGSWADAGHVRRVSGIALVLLAGSWVLIGQLPWSLWLLVAGVVVLDFAVQAVHVGNQHLLTSTFPERSSAVVGGYMVFYSLGSALGAIASTALYVAAGWSAPSVLGAVFAACAFIVWGAGRPRNITEARQRTQKKESAP